AAAVRDNARLLLSLPARRDELDAIYQRRRERLGMPRTAAAVGSAQLDMLGNDQGLVVAGGLPYLPRPVFQSPAASNAYLLRRNARFLSGPEAPRYLLVKLDPIDGRWAASEDSLA